MLAAFSQWAIPLLFLRIPLAGWVRGVKLYEAFVRGAEQGFNTAVKIIPLAGAASTSFSSAF